MQTLVILFVSALVIVPIILGAQEKNSEKGQDNSDLGGCLIMAIFIIAFLGYIIVSILNI